MVRQSSLLFPLSLLLAWLYDLLFWGKPDGISFPVFVALALAVGFYLARRNGVRAARRSLWLLAPIALFAIMSILRLEPFSLFLSRAFTLFLMALLAASFLGGRWTEYGLSDFMARLATFVPRGWIKSRQGRQVTADDDRPRSGLRRAGPILRGLLLALPILWVLGALLAAADPIFANWLAELFSWLRLERLSEYLWRITYIMALAYVLAGVYFYALHSSQDETLIGEDKPLVKAFLGFGEAATVLVSVELLFAAFVAIQLRYFFGGEANVTAAGFTYAEYARRGFAELVIVAVLALLLFMLFSNISKRQAARAQKAFSGLGVALMLLVGVMLISAYQRLLLYESAYGFTRFRTFAHTFMIWLGLLLLAVAFLEAIQRPRAFALAGLLAALGFAASLSLLNVDAFITDANVARARQGYPLDVQHLGQLSEDAVPGLIQQFQQASRDQDSPLEIQLAAALACHAAQHDEYAALPDWQSLHFARWQARQLWAALRESPSFEGLGVSVSGSLHEGHMAEVQGQSFECENMLGKD